MEVGWGGWITPLKTLEARKTYNPVHVSLPMEKMIMMHSDPIGLKLGKD